MFTLPASSMPIIGPFAQVFNHRIWDLVQVLLIGAILTPGKRTVSAILRTLGLHERSDYQNYHRVLNRAKWSPLELSRILLGLLVERLVGADEPLVLAVDETLERRQGEKIAAKGVFRDAVRSSAKYTVHSYGLRWLSMMLLVKLPWSPQPWALPFLTLLAPSAATDEAAGRRHKSSIEWIMQLLSLLRRWQPKRRLILVTDGGLTAVKLGLQALKHKVTYISRLRLDAALYEFATPKVPGTRGKQALKGPRAPSLSERLDDPASQWRTVEVPWYGGRTRTMELLTGTNL